MRETAVVVRSTSSAQLIPRCTSAAAGRSAAWYGHQGGIHFRISSKVRPGSTARSTMANALSPETTTSTRRMSSNGRATGAVGGAEEAHPARDIAATARTVVKARNILASRIFWHGRSNVKAKLPRGRAIRGGRFRLPVEYFPWLRQPDAVRI